MLNKVLIDKLGAEIKALYLLSTRQKLSTSRYHFDVAYDVRKLRVDFGKREFRDKLADKLKNLGNNGGFLRNYIDQKKRIIYNAKQPLDNDTNWISVEIEQIFTDGGEEEFKKWALKSGYANQVTIKDDGSLLPVVGHDNGCDCDDCSQATCKEIVVSFKANDTIILRDICYKLNELGSYVNTSCGLHVHFDFRHRKAATVTSKAKKIAACVDALKLILPKSRRHNHFCETKINKIGQGSRYAFVNLRAYQKHKTLEIRGHSGTIDANKILNWIAILSTIMNSRDVASESSTVEQLLLNYKFSTEIVAYIMRRYAKFNPSHFINRETPVVEAVGDHYEQEEIETLEEIAA